MATGRQDAWTMDEDRLLAEIVLEHIRAGSTQLKAFEEVGGKLARTAAACGFRWNSFVRKKYKNEIAQAKKERKAFPKQERKERDRVVREETKEQPKIFSTKDIIQYLMDMEEAQSNIQSETEIQERLKRENEGLREELAETKKQLDKLKNEYHRLKNDYASLLGILEKAREVAAISREESRQKAEAQT